MNKFVFIINLFNFKQLKRLSTFFRIAPEFITRLTLRNSLPFKISHLRNIQSSRGVKIEGWLIGCPLFQREAADLFSFAPQYGIYGRASQNNSAKQHRIISVDLRSRIEKNFILDRIIAALRIAERLGANIIGLDGLNAQVIDKECEVIAKNSKIPVTTGLAFTAWSIFESVYRIAKVKNIQLKKSCLAVIDAATPLGSLSARKLSFHLGRIILISKDGRKLEELKETVLDNNYPDSSAEIITQEDVFPIAKEADIIININNSQQTTFNIEELKPNAILCNVSSPGNTRRQSQSKNRVIIEGGLVKLPFPDKTAITIGLPKGIIYASLAETMLLTFAGKFTNYSLSESINLDKLEEIADRAMQHGFEVWVPQAPVL